jgi:hypothetical protein
MPDPISAKDSSLLNRLRRRISAQKILLLAILLFIIAVVCFVVSYRLEHRETPVSKWLDYLPLHSFGDACFVAALVGFGYEWFIRSESEKILEAKIEAIVKASNAETAERLRDLIFYQPTLMARVSTPIERRAAIQTILRADTSNGDLAAEAYEKAVHRATNYPYHWTDYRCSVTLSTITDSRVHSSVREEYFHCYYDIRYDRVWDSQPLIFSCVSSQSEFNNQIADKNCEMCWLFPFIVGSNYSEGSGFLVRDVHVADIPLTVEKQLDRNEARVVYSAMHPKLGELRGKHIPVRFRVESRVKRKAHILALNYGCPVKGVSMEIDVTSTDITRLTVRDFFASDRLPVIKLTPDNAETARKISVQIDDWVFPKGGVVFGWSLKK